MIFQLRKIFRHPWVFTSLDLGVQMHRAYVHELQCAVFCEICGPNGIRSRRCDEKLSFFAEQLASAARNFLRRREYINLIELSIEEDFSFFYSTITFSIKK